MTVCVAITILALHGCISFHLGKTVNSLWAVIFKSPLQVSCEYFYLQNCKVNDSLTTVKKDILSAHNIFRNKTLNFDVTTYKT
jgi:hypothetical protein